MNSSPRSSRLNRPKAFDTPVRSATRTPFVRWVTSPAHEPYERITIDIPPDCIGRHLVEATLAGCKRLLDGADVVGRDVDRDPLVRLVDLAVDGPQEDFGARGSQLE